MGGANVTQQVLGNRTWGFSPALSPWKTEGGGGKKTRVETSIFPHGGGGRRGGFLHGNGLFER